MKYLPAVLSTKNYEAEIFLEAVAQAASADIADEESRLAFKGSHFALLNSEVWSCVTGAAVTTKFPEGGYLRVQFHHKGHGTARIGQREFSISPCQAVVSPAAAQIDFSPDFEQTVLNVSDASLAQTISALTGKPLVQPLRFKEVFNPATMKPLIFKTALDFLISNLCSFGKELPSTILLEMEQVVITSFLNCCQNNYSHALELQPPKAASRQVRRVEEFIEANWNQPIKISDILAISGCSARSIFRTFKQSRGFSPMTFVKHVRLRHAREMLLSEENVKVSQIAFACAFPDLGRFSRDYAKAYGELPSATIKQKSTASRHYKKTTHSS